MTTAVFALRLLTLFLLVLLLSACGSTSYKSEGTNTRPELNKLDGSNVAVRQYTLQTFNEIVQVLDRHNSRKGNWDENINSYAQQTMAGANTRYLKFSSTLHNTLPDERCSSSSISTMQSALKNHPSSLPILAYALNCAERFELSEQQAVIANSIGIVAEKLLNAKGGGKGKSKSTPILVREMYEGEYLLGLAGIEIFETEMWLEKERLLILHHGIDQITNQYALIFADQSDFFFQSLSASFTKAGIEAMPKKDMLVSIKTKAMRDGGHFSMALWDLRQQLYAGNYDHVIEQIRTNNYNTPAAISMLVLSYLATGNDAGIAANENNIVLYAELGIPESQAIAAMLLMRMSDSAGHRFDRELTNTTLSDVNQDVTLAIESFSKSVESLGVENASQLWVRTLLGDKSMKVYLPFIVSKLPAESRDYWSRALAYIAQSDYQQSDMLKQQLADFQRILSSAGEQTLAASKGTF